MSLILHLDTAASRLMIGLSRNDEMISRFVAQTESHRYHSAMLVPAIQQVLDEARASVRDLTALAVNHGPGSFTGIRTGITTARTMAQFLKLPVHVFNSFELLAADADLAADEPVAVYLDALRNRAYQAVLQFEDIGPMYVQAPALHTLQANEPVPVAAKTIIAAAALHPLLAVSSSVCIRSLPADGFTPAAMLALINRYGAFFSRPWPEVKPLYLQEPSITLRKTK